MASMGDEGWEIVGKEGTCESCDQDTTMYDKDLLPERQVLLRWRCWKQKPAANDDPCGGRWNRTGNECAVCYETRRRYFGIDKKALDEKREDPAENENFQTLRRKRARGEDRYERKAGRKTITTSKKDEQYEDVHVQGTFMLLDNYIKKECGDRGLHQPALKKLTLDRKLDFVKNTLGAMPVKGKRNQWGVEVIDQAPGDYRFKRGLRSSTEQEEREEHDNLGQSAVALAENLRADHPFSSSSGVRFNNADQDPHDGQLAAHSSGEPQDAPPCKRRKIDDLETMSAASPTPTGPAHRLASSASSLRSASAIVRPRATSPEGSDDDTRSLLSLGTDAGTPGSAKKRPKKGTSATLSRALRSSSAQKILEASQELVTDTETNHSAQAMWDTKWKSRDIQNLSARLATAAQKASSIAEPQAQEVSGKLLDLSEQIAARGKLFVKLRERPMELTTKLEDDERDLFSTWPGSLSVNILSQVGSSIASRVDLASVTACLRMSSLSALEQQLVGEGTWRLSADPSALNLSILMVGKTKSADLTTSLSQCIGSQTLFVVTMAEKLLRMTDVNAYIKLWDQIWAADVLPDKVSLVRFGESTSGPVVLYDGWALQPATDLSALMVAAKLLKAKSEQKQPSAMLKNVAKQMVACRGSLSVRLRTALAPRSSGCHNTIVGTAMWEIASALQCASQNSGKSRETFLAVWTKLKFQWLNDLGEMPGSDVAAANQVSEWFERLDAEKEVEKLYEAFEGMENDDDEVVTAKEEMQVLHSNLSDLAHRLLSGSDMCDTFLSHVFAGSQEVSSADEDDTKDKQELIFGWEAEILPVVQKLATICSAPSASLLTEACTRLRSIASAMELFDAFTNASKEEAFTGEVASSFIKRAADLWQDWAKIQKAAITLEGDVLGKWLTEGLRPRPFDQFPLQVLKLCLAKPVVSETAISTAKDLQDVLPEESKPLVAMYSKWQQVQAVAQKLSQCKLVGHFELAQAAGYVHDMKGTIIGGVEVAKFNDTCAEVNTGYGKAMETFIKKNGQMDEEQTTAWVDKFAPIGKAVESWDFSGLSWFGVDPETEEGKAVKKYVTTMEGLVLVADTRSREVENLLRAVGWDEARRASLHKVLGSLNFLAKEATKIKMLLAQIVVAELLCKEPVQPSAVDQVKLYISLKLGIKDLATLGTGVAERLGAKPQQPPAAATKVAVGKKIRRLA